MRLLVTGGCGYISSHFLVEALAAGYETIVLDNLINSSKESLTRVAQIAGKSKPPILCHVDLCNKEAVDQVFATHGPFDAVVHFAGLKAVG